MVSFPHKVEKPIRIILVEDDRDDRELFAEALTELNISSELTVLVNGLELMKALNNPILSKPDIIILDINMPKKNGHECLKEIKSSPTLKEIPCIIFSSSTRESDIPTSYHLGAEVFLSKPTSFTDLVSVIKNIIDIDWGKFHSPYPSNKF